MRKIRLIELGPGRGTLMADILRVSVFVRLRALKYSNLCDNQTLSQFAASKEAVQEVLLVETSESMKALQKEKLGPLAAQTGRSLQWFDSLDDIPADSDKFTMIVAHEFFDALPFHLLQVPLHPLR